MNIISILREFGNGIITSGTNNKVLNQHNISSMIIKRQSHIITTCVFIALGWPGFNIVITLRKAVKIFLSSVCFLIRQNMNQRYYCIVMFIKYYYNRLTLSVLENIM